MKSVFKNQALIVLLFLTVLGGILRFWRLDSFPASPNWDEVSHGYNAYSVLMSGKDEWGKSFPLIFRAFGDFKLPFYIYLTALPVWFFGLNVFAIRFISALAGTLAIPGLYLLTKVLFPDRKITLGFAGKLTLKLELFAAFVLAINPWHFFISRPALEANLSLTLIIFGAYYLVRFFQERYSLLPSVILLGLSLHTYNTARVFVPLLVLVSFLIFRPKLKFQFKNLLAITMAILFSSLVVFQVYLGEGTARYEKLKILSPSAVFQIGENRAKSNLPPLISKLIYNRPVFLVTTITKNYFSYFSPDFFSQKWGAQFQFAIPNQNLLTLPVFLLAFLGVFAYLVRVKSDKSFQFLYSWFFLSPIAASLTIDPPQALRPNPLIPAIIILASLGLARLLTIVPSKIRLLFSLVIFVWLLISFVLYFKIYTGEYKTKYSSSWQYGHDQVMDYINKHGKDYEKIFITKRYGEPHIFYAFFSKLNPEAFQPGPDSIRFGKSDWFWTDKIDDIYFINDWQIPTTSVSKLSLESGSEIPTARSLLITSPDHIPVNAHIIETIKFLDGSPAFIITSVP